MKFKNIITKTIVVICLLLSVLGFSQKSVLDKKITIQAHKQTIAAILEKIEKLANVNFVYVSGLFDKNKIVSLTLTNSSLKTALQKTLQSNDILLYVIDNKIIFYKKDEQPPGKEGTIYALTQVDVSSKEQSEYRPVELVKQTITDTVKVTLVDTVKILRYDTVKIIEHIPTKEKPQTTQSNLNTNIPFGGSVILSLWGGVSGVHENILSKSQPLMSSIISQGEKIKTLYFEKGIAIDFGIKNFDISTGIGFINK